MKKEVKSILIGASILLVLGLTLGFALKKKGKANSGFPLQKGSTGAKVKALQTYLNDKNKNSDILEPLETDGIFGALTGSRLAAAEGVTTLSEKKYKELNIKKCE